MRDPKENGGSTPCPDHDEAAAMWLWRLDRGLTANEQDEFFAWLGSDARHAAALGRQRALWRRLRPLGAWRPEHSRRPNPDLLAAPSKPARRRIRFPVLLATAAALILGFALHEHVPWGRLPPPDQPAVGQSHDQRRLDDGSILTLNAGARVTVLYSGKERRVRLERGEAFFAVVKDVDRPFVVEAQGASVTALGTAFNVRISAAACEVLVASGRVRVVPPLSALLPANAVQDTVLEARQRAVVSVAADGAPPQVDTLTPDEIRRFLTWQHGPIRFVHQPLSAVVAEFNRLNSVQLIITDAELAETRFSGTIRSDNVEAFVRLLELAYGVTCERRSELEIILRHQAR